MVDLSTKYMGLDLKNPIIIGSCGLVNSVEKIKKLEKNGAAAVVLKSLFEEQILSEIDSLSGDSNYSEVQEYLSYFTKDYNISKHLDLIRDAKKEISIPIIASINCSNADGWTDYAKKIEDAGADALELNVFILPTDANSSSEEIEKLYFDIVKNVNKEISIPFSIKIGSYFSSLAKTVVKLSKTDLAGIVMFNRFYNPDIDLETLEIKPSNVFSNPSDLFNTLRWIALLSDKVDCDLIATNGIHDGAGVIKSILTGAKFLGVVLPSTEYDYVKHGIHNKPEEVVEYIKYIVKEGKKLGIKKFLIINCHGGNTIISNLLNDLENQYNVKIILKNITFTHAATEELSIGCVIGIADDDENRLKEHDFNKYPEIGMVGLKEARENNTYIDKEAEIVEKYGVKIDRELGEKILKKAISECVEIVKELTN